MDLILYNPKSKNSKGNVQTHKLVRYYRKHKIPFRLKSILKIDDMKTFVDEANHIDKIILLGGDGTINQLVNSLANSDVKQEIYIKKNGSGNDFLRSLRTADDKPQHIMKYTMDDNESKYFINGCGIGIDGLVIDYVDNAQKKGKLSYFLSTLRALFKFVPEPISVNIDGKDITFDKGYSVIINNGRFVGGGMEMSPKANINNENLDVTIIHSIPKLFMLIIFSTVYFGWHTKFTKYVYTTTCKKIKASFTTPQIIQADGEKTLDVQTLEVESSQKTIHLKAY